MAFESDTKLGHYEITDEIGKGGMGEVYRARDTKLGRLVAIKVLPSEFAQDSERLARLEREARMLAALNHPNIASIHGLEESDGTRFLVLELVEGDTLDDRLQRGAIPLEESLKLALQIAEALEAAHEKGVIHRDLKPANIKITPEGKVKILDFGLAKAVDGDAAAAGDAAASALATQSIGATRQGAVLGTPGYMSPEQARGETTDKRTDIWAFGCILFEMITGRKTFDGNTLTDALASVIAREPEWQLVPRDIHPRIRLLLERCLEKDLKRRYHDIAESRVDIDAALADPDGIFPGVRDAPSGRVVVPWVVAAASVVAAAVIWAIASFSPSPTGNIASFVASAYPSPPIDVGNSNVPLLAISPDGSQVAYPVVLDGELTIYLRDLDELAGRRLRPEGIMAVPFYSPDGRDMGFLDPTGATLKRARVDGSDSPETLYEYGGNFPFGASFDEDGNIVFALINDDRGLLRMPDRGGPVEEVLPLTGDEEQVYPDVLPGGRGILFTSITGEGEAARTAIEVLDLRTNQRRVLADPGSQPRYLDAGFIAYNDAGTVRAVAFDLDRMEVRGDSVAMLDGIEHYPDSFGAQFAVSRNGSLVYMNRSSIPGATERTLAVVDRSGRRTPLEARTGPYMHPRVSPDGAEVAVQTLDADNQGTIWIYNFERNALRRLSGAGSNVRPIWTPDGVHITFASNRDGGWGIYWQRADGSDVATRLTTADEGWEHYPDSWSPDGRWLMFTNIIPNSGGMQSIWGLDLEGGDGPVPLTEPVSGGAEFSPKGDWIAYRLNNQVVVEPFPGTGALYQVTEDGGSYPVWSPDGDQLLYRRAVGARGSASAPLVMVDVTSDGAFTFGNEQVPPINGFQTFFGYRDYDFMPDGERLVMVFPSGLAVGEELVPRVNVVLNWAEELEERVPLSRAPWWQFWN